MLTPLILETLALLALVWVLAVLIRIPSERLPSRERMVVPLAAAALLLLGAAALNAIVYLNAPGAAAAASFGTRSGLQSRAQNWLEKHESEPPKADEVGRNIRIISDGLPFLRPYHAQLPPHLRLQLEEASRLPTKLTRMLSATEERQYYDAARAVMESVRTLAAQPGA